LVEVKILYPKNAVYFHGIVEIQKNVWIYTNMTDFYQFLADHHVEYERHDHSPVYTVEEAERLVPALAGAKSKNLFFRDKKGARHFLVVVSAKKRVNIKALPLVLESSRLSFGSPRRLEKYLGVQPGAVTLLAIFNDPEQHVEVYIDRELWESDAFNFHPLVNTSTLVITHTNLQRFIEATGHAIQVVDVPGQEESDLGF
jgi:Ala-tRNA(Pro) deacylase